MLLEDCSAGLCRAQKQGSVDRVDGMLGVLNLESNMTAACGKSLPSGPNATSRCPAGHSEQRPLKTNDQTLPMVTGRSEECQKLPLTQ